MNRLTRTMATVGAAYAVAFGCGVDDTDPSTDSEIILERVEDDPNRTIYLAREVIDLVKSYGFTTFETPGSLAVENRIFHVVAGTLFTEVIVENVGECDQFVLKLDGDWYDMDDNGFPVTSEVAWTLRAFPVYAPARAHTSPREVIGFIDPTPENAAAYCERALADSSVLGVSD